MRMKNMKKKMKYGYKIKKNKVKLIQTIVVFK